MARKKAWHFPAQTVEGLAVSSLYRNFRRCENTRIVYRALNVVKTVVFYKN